MSTPNILDTRTARQAPHETARTLIVHDLRRLARHLLEAAERIEVAVDPIRAARATVAVLATTTSAVTHVLDRTGGGR